MYTAPGAANRNPIIDVMRVMASPMGNMRYSDHSPAFWATSLCPSSWSMKLRMTRTTLRPNSPR